MKQINENAISSDVFSDPEAEQSVLRVILSEGHQVETAMDWISENDFLDPCHRLIFGAMGGLAEKQVPIEVSSVVASLKDSGTLNQAGGGTYVQSLAAKFTDSDESSFMTCLNKIAEKSQERRLIQLLRLVPELGEGFDSRGKKAEELTLDGFTMWSGTTTARLTVERPLQGTMPQGHRYAYPSVGFRDSSSRERYRRDFMELVAEQVPEVLEDLACWVFAKYREVQQVCPTFVVDLQNFIAAFEGIEGARTAVLEFNLEASDLSQKTTATPTDRAALESRASSAVALLDSLIDWSDRHQLKDRWILEEYAIPTLGWWAMTLDFETLKIPRPLAWNQRTQMVPMDLDSPFAFEYPKWDMENEDWGTYKRLLMEAFRVRLGRYAKRKREDAHREGTVILRRADKRRRWKYLLQYQLRRKERSDVFDEALAEVEDLNERRRTNENVPDQSTVNKAINTAADLIGLTLRPSATRTGRRRV